MTEDQINYFRFGYDECRQVHIFRLRKIWEMETGCMEALQELIQELEADQEADHLEAIQKEQPGITIEEYERQLDETMKEIRETFYHPNGRVKPRLVPSLTEGQAKVLRTLEKGEY